MVVHKIFVRKKKFLSQTNLFGLRLKLRALERENVFDKDITLVLICSFLHLPKSDLQVVVQYNLLFLLESIGAFSFSLLKEYI